MSLTPRALAIIAACLFLLASTPTQAAPPAERPDLLINTSLELAPGIIAEDAFAELNLKFSLYKKLPSPWCILDRCDSPLRLELIAPLHLRLNDRPPKDNSVLRQQDWDQSADLLRILRLLSYGDSNTPVHLAIGALGPVSIGHGTLVFDYLNIISPDIYKLGLNARASTAYVSATVMLDELIDPSLSVARLQAYPLSSLGIGLSFLADWDSPTALDTTQGQDQLIVAPGQRPSVAQSARTIFWGADLTQWISKGPTAFSFYQDVNVHTRSGLGLHLGAQLALDLAGVVQWRQRAELILSWGGYIPRYVGPLYELERYQSVGYGSPIPLPRAKLAQRLEQSARPGFFTDTELRIPALNLFFNLAASQQGDDTSTANIYSALRAHPIDDLWLATTLAHQGGWNLLSSGRALWINEVRYNLTDWLYLQGRFNRLWRLHPEGRFEPITEAFLGAGLSLTLE